MDPITLISLIMSAASTVSGGIQATEASINSNSNRKTPAGREKDFLEQLSQQQRLNESAAETNYSWGEKAANNAFERAMQMYNRTYQDNSPANKIKQLEDAGLSVGLMYGGNSPGGMGQATTQPMGQGAGAQQGGRAPNAVEKKMAELQEQALGLQISKLGSEIAVNNSVAKKNEADAKLANEEATTTTNSREVMIEKLKQEGMGQWIENVQQRYKSESMYRENAQLEVTMFKNKLYGTLGMTNKSMFTEQEAMKIAEAYTAANANAATAELTNEKVKGYWTELLNATKEADAEAMKAAALKLSAEWTTGEFTNWKTWVDTSMNVVNEISGIIAGSTKKGGMTINNNIPKK